MAGQNHKGHELSRRGVLRAGLAGEPGYWSHHLVRHLRAGGEAGHTKRASSFLAFSYAASFAPRARYRHHRRWLRSRAVRTKPSAVPIDSRISAASSSYISGNVGRARAPYGRARTLGVGRDAAAALRRGAVPPSPGSGIVVRQSGRNSAQ